MEKRSTRFDTPNQPSLPGMAEPTWALKEGNNRLFIGIFFSATVASRLTWIANQLCSEHRLRGPVQEEARFHITLHHFGDLEDFPQGFIEAIREICEMIATSLPSFDIELSRACSFNTSLVLTTKEGNSELFNLQKLLETALKARGLPFDKSSSFTPHITLIYNTEKIAKQSIEPFKDTVTEIVLIHSLLGKTKHIPLGRWPLQA